MRAQSWDQGALTWGRWCPEDLEEPPGEGSDEGGRSAFRSLRVKGRGVCATGVGRSQVWAFSPGSLTATTRIIVSLSHTHTHTILSHTYCELTVCQTLD